MKEMLTFSVRGHCDTRYWKCQNLCFGTSNWQLFSSENWDPGRSWEALERSRKVCLSALQLLQCSALTVEEPHSYVLLLYRPALHTEWGWAPLRDSRAMIANSRHETFLKVGKTKLKVYQIETSWSQLWLIWCLLAVLLTGAILTH